ncbi:MAG: ATP citrate synthase [Flavobacteriales bacterium]|nr:hypothetical protein [Flavobacteriales bacterium]MCB9448517.1 ATP citrate synthase [Flavobacteriales bacterium]
MSRPDYILFDKESTAIIFNNQPRAVQRMLDYDYVIGRKQPSVVAIVNPSGKGLYPAMFGHRECLIPVYATTAEAVAEHPAADVFINFASLRSAWASTRTAMNHDSLRTFVVVAEGMPERQARELAQIAEEKGKWLIGPATVGAIAAGAFKTGNSAGTVDNIVHCKLFRPGHVGFVSKSGGMSNEMYNVIAKHTSGIYEGVALGGDRFPGSTATRHLVRMNANPDIAMLVYLGETGGNDEYEMIEAVQKGEITKPLVVWVTGGCARLFPGEAQFGHAGASARNETETTEAKLEALRKSGIHVPESFDDLGSVLGKVFDQLKRNGKVRMPVEPKFPHVPVDFDEALRSKLIRNKPSIISTISDDRGEELTYNNIPISRIVREQYGPAGVISELWFKRRLPPHAIAFMEMVLVLVADHGPAVSGAHNAIVAARAGKDLVSSLASGLLTVGPRFGGAIDDAAKVFSHGMLNKLSPLELIENHKNAGQPIPGIGHRVKSLENPDMRVEILKEFVFSKFPASPILKYALEVEALTTRKKNTLILNVDGAIGAAFADILFSGNEFTPQEAERYLELGALNGLFVVGRSIGIIGHFLDQRRLEQPLYRHAYHDIAYMG